MAIRPTVAIIGESGTGKSSSLENLPPDKTIILNAENKELPLSNFGKFKNIMVESYKKLDATLDALKTEEYKAKFDYVVLDSFTSTTEMVYTYSNKVYSGYEIWAMYNEMITALIKKIKVLPQQVFLIAIPEQKAESFGETKEFARVKGKELKYGFLEKELAIVLFTNPEYALEAGEDTEEGEMTEVYLDYKPNKRNSAKAPRKLFKGKITNDAMAISKAIDEFYGN